ncbi:acyltransferase family protein [Leptospira sarikeiensis]|uniref:Acyltransferase n=1 Tax=Leptospira sarikeiensis TaxID=2484943 RepID=A0A4R9KHB2_9LEPT|nr:acyltransferase [Leptospira sarikeiensis]TGL65800.1 acyltransferase [Leptospira sarikeiensis]
MKFLPFLFEKREDEHPALNGLRAFSIFLVILFHMGIIFKSDDPRIIWFLQNLRTGVDLFFMLSGFLIYGGLLNEYKRTSKLDLKSFYLKRTLRIMPAYYFCILINYIQAKSAYKLLDKIPTPTQAEIVAHQKLGITLSNTWGDVLYISNYFKERLFQFGWSLSVEEQFYLIVPSLCLFLLFKVKENVRRTILVILFFIPLIIRVVYHFIGIDRILVEVHTETRFDFLILGMLIAELTRWKPEFFQKSTYKTGLLFSVGLLAVLIFTFQLKRTGANSIFIFTLFQLGYGLLFTITLVEGSFWNKIFSLSVFRPVARTSYTMYLWHDPFIGLAIFTLFGKNFSPQTSIWAFLLIGIYATALIFLLCIPIFYAIERPFLALKDFLIRRLKSKKEINI